MVLCSFHRSHREICTRNRPLSETKFLDDFCTPPSSPGPFVLLLNQGAVDSKKHFGSCAATTPSMCLLTLVGPIRSRARSEFFDRTFPIIANREIRTFRSQAFALFLQFRSPFQKSSFAKFPILIAMFSCI